MSKVLRLQFTGLCAFVPTEGKKEMRVVLVDASRPHGEHDKGHRPVIIFPEGSYHEDDHGTRDYDEAFESPDGDNYLLCKMEGQDFRVAGAADNSLEFDLGFKKDCPKRDKSDSEVFGWLANMR